MSTEAGLLPRRRRFVGGRNGVRVCVLVMAPLVLALVLGDLAENALRQSLIMSQGSLLIFFDRPISGAITAVALFFFLLPVITPWWRRLRGLPAAAVSPRET